MDLSEYLANGISDFLDRHPEHLSGLAIDDVLQMEVLREYVDVNGNLAVATSQIEVAAIQTFNGRFELLSLSAPAITGMPAGRISSLDWEQLAEAVALLLPDTSVEDGVRQALGGMMIVPFERWLEVKRNHLHRSGSGYL